MVDRQNLAQESPSVKAPFVQWGDLDAMIAEAVYEYQKINSGIHMSLLATNRSGKTTLATGGGNPGQGLLRHFEDVLVLDTTADPGPISSYGKPLPKFGRIRGHMRLTVGDMSTKSREKLLKGIRRAHDQKGPVAIYADEIRQLTDRKYFALGPQLDFLWLFGAKQGTSLVGSTQAPLWVPGAFYDQAKLHFLFHIRDERRMKRLSEIGGDTKTLREIIPHLQRYHFAYVDLDGDVYTSKFVKRPTRNPEAEENRRVQVLPSERREGRVTVTRKVRSSGRKLMTKK